MIRLLHRCARDSAVGSAICVIITLALCVSAEAAGGRFEAHRAGFSVKLKDVVSDLSVMGVYLLPKEAITLEVTGAAAGDFHLETASGTVLDRGPNKWRWEAPGETGLYQVSVSRPPWARGSAPDSITLNVFVMVPYERMDGESLCGYRIGRYPSPSLRKLPKRARPRGFIEVTAENAGTLISPHFRLEQFLCKQDGGYPKYAVLSERLLLKLERILERTNERGYNCETFQVMSGYRTPHYNKALGNVPNSLHLWGWAADIFIDQSPQDGAMDDLNRDGKVSVLDAAVLYDIIDEMFAEPSHKALAGGLAKYRKTKSHGPFVHVDVRGRRARW